MKNTISLLFLSLSLNAYADHWDCKGVHNLKQVSFDFNSSIEKFHVVAPDLDQKGLQEAFTHANSYTITAYQLLDNRAQETIDYTLVIDRSAKSVQVFSQWSTNENVDSEFLVCNVK